MMNQIHDEIKLNKTKGTYRGIITTKATPYTKEVLVGEIPISSYFGVSVKEFYEKFKNVNGTMKWTFNVQIDRTNIPIVSESYKYKVDGKAISERAPEYDDVIQIFATVQVPVEQIATKSGKSERYQMDFNPTTGHKYHVAEDGFQSVIPLDIDDAAYVPVSHNSKELLSKAMNVYMIPYRLRFISNDETQPNQVIPNTYAYNTLRHTLNEKAFELGEPEYNQTLFRLGKVAVQSQRQLERDTILLDTRSRGGGLNENISKKEIARTDERSLANWDIGYFDGETYQENGVVVLKIADDILDGVNDEAIKENLFRQAFNKYKALGIMPIIEFYKPNSSGNDLLENGEFINYKHINYHSPKHSSGKYAIKILYEGSGDDFILDLEGSAVYVIRVPGYKLANGTDYQIEIKAKLHPSANIRKVATIQLSYLDGTSETIEMANVVESRTWQVLTSKIEVRKDILEARVLINKSNANLMHNLYIDYVKLLSKGRISNTEEKLEL